MSRRKRGDETNRMIKANNIRTPEDGYKELALHVIWQALHDYKYYPKQRPYLKKRFFTDNKDFVFWCDVAGVDPYLILRKIHMLESKNKNRRIK